MCMMRNAGRRQEVQGQGTHDRGEECRSEARNAVRNAVERNAGGSEREKLPMDTLRASGCPVFGGRFCFEDVCKASRSSRSHQHIVWRNIN